MTSKSLVASVRSAAYQYHRVSIRSDPTQPSLAAWKGGPSLAEQERYKDWANTVVGRYGLHFTFPADRSVDQNPNHTANIEVQMDQSGRPQLPYYAKPEAEGLDTLRETLRI